MTLSIRAPKVVDVTKFSDAVSEAERRSAVKGPRGISRAAKAKGYTLSHGTVSKALNGTHGNVSDLTVEALAAVLPIAEAKLFEALGVTGPGPYEPPDAANRLTQTQRDLVNTLIHQIVRPKEGTGHVAEPAQKIHDVEVATETEELEGPKPKQRRGPRTDS